MTREKLLSGASWATWIIGALATIGLLVLTAHGVDTGTANVFVIIGFMVAGASFRRLAERERNLREVLSDTGKPDDSQ